MQAAEGVSESTCKALCCRGAGCLSGVSTYLPGTGLQSYRLFKWCRNLPAGHYVAGGRLFKGCLTYLPGMVLQAVKWCQNFPQGAVLGRGAGCLSGVQTYLPCTVGQGFRLFKPYQNLPAGQ